MKIIYHGHACFELRSKDGSAIFDPYAPGKVPGLVLPALSADSVICSHGHTDHSYAEGVTLSGGRPSFGVESFSCFHDEVQGAKRGLNTLTVLTAEGIRVAHCGDLGHMMSDDTVQAIGAVDVLMVPAGGYYTIGADEAFRVCQALKAKLILPMHCRTSSAGYDVLSPVSDFLDLFSPEEIMLLNGDSLDVELPSQRKVAVFRGIR